ncbi:MAG TPA: DUF3078 domain-containing protein [Flavobacterium sp.]|jgi:hypothetical protein
MKTTIVYLIMLLTCIQLHSQEVVPAQVPAATEVIVDTTSAWTAKGNASFLFNQSTFDNWLPGGENNISGNININYDFNYIKDDYTWDNKVIASYGLVKTRTSAFAKKTDDRLELISLLGKKATGQWYYSAFLNFKTQFSKGYVYDKEVNGAEIRTEYTDFLSPAYLYFGPGMLWKRDDNLKVNLSPLTSKLTFVDKNMTLPNEAYFGVEEGKSMRYELGFNAAAYYKFGVIANVSFENILNLYSNYLENPDNVDLDYQLNIVLKVNRYLSTNISFQTIYDDNAFKGFQIRQVFGVGINYGF